MKKILIIALFLLIIKSMSLDAYTATGHEMFSEILFEDEGTLLVNMTTSEINKGYKDIGRAKFIGWKHHFFTIKQKAVYVGETLFAKTNRSSAPLKISYKYKDTQTKERSVTYSGSLSGKFKTNIKAIDLELNSKLDTSVKTITTNQSVQETSFDVVVMPNYKLVFRETGDALVTNGVSKYYFFGITTNKGEWEYIDVVTKYYELYEEEL